MVPPENFLEELGKNRIEFFCGVPDSLLKNFCACVDEIFDKKSHIITANEGNALALAAGYHLSTGKTGLVYMQNSGMGNIINPLASLTDPEVYRIPALLLIGWRGEPGGKDEPQHVKQGRISKELLDVMEIPFEVLSGGSDYAGLVRKVVSEIETRNSPAAILVRKDTFAEYKDSKETEEKNLPSREVVLREIVKLSSEKDIFVSTTGKTSRELYELRAVEGGGRQKDFLTVGSMGHTSSIALGVALGNPRRRVICLDGDGSMLMHMGAMAVIGDAAPGNMIHIILNNASHESVGGQPTVAGCMNLKRLAESCGYKNYFFSDTLDSIKDVWHEIKESTGPLLFELKIKQGSRSDLGRPAESPEANKQKFMEHAREG